ncbi:MAG TPA: outer membrane protein transport protein [Thermoanaerobaculia bacterium]
MRIRTLTVFLAFALTAGVHAQNTDIEALAGLQFNFGNPGARSLGMGGAFLGLADDASAAEANPAGLSILRKAEVSLEVRNYLENQILTTSGTFPDFERTAFGHHSDRAVISFASAVVPVRNFTFGAYFHEPLRNQGAGAVIPQRNPLTGQIEKDLPVFYMEQQNNQPIGGPLSFEECEAVKDRNNDPFSCLGYEVFPFISALDVQQRTFGVAGAWQVTPKFSVGATARYHTFKEDAFTFRIDRFFNFVGYAVQATGDVSEDGTEIEIKEETDFTFTAGFKWAPSDKLSFGGVYKKGPTFDAPTFLATDATDRLFVRVGNTEFHTPDVAGLGVSYRPIPVLTINFDAVHVKYTNLVDDFTTTVAIGDLDEPYITHDVTELHLGGEYFFATRIPFAIRAGYWREPAHAIEYNGPLDTPDRIAAAFIYPEGKDQNHFSIGAGIALPRFQIDFAYDTSDTYKVGSISMVTRF